MFSKRRGGSALRRRKASAMERKAAGIKKEREVERLLVPFLTLKPRKGLFQWPCKMLMVFFYFVLLA